MFCIDNFSIPLTRLSLKFTISSKVFPSQSSVLSSNVVSQLIGGTIGPTPTFGYPYEPTKIDGGLEPLIESELKRFPYLDRYSCQLFSIVFLISVLEELDCDFIICIKNIIGIIFFGGNNVD